MLKRARLCMRDAMTLWKVGMRSSIVKTYEKLIFEEEGKHEAIQMDC